MEQEGLELQANAKCELCVLRYRGPHLPILCCVTPNDSFAPNISRRGKPCRCPKADIVGDTLLVAVISSRPCTSFRSLLSPFADMEIGSSNVFSALEGKICNSPASHAMPASLTA